jgi:DNA-binding GntR family transcriptional regulator
LPDGRSNPRLKVAPLEITAGLRRLACEAIKRAITEMDIYGQPGELRLDERQLSQDLGVSRTPIREALSILEQEGFVRSVPRRGIHVVRKTKREVVEMITVWAAIEGMAARLAAPRITAEQLGGLRTLVDAFDDDPSGQLTEYSEANMAFHKAIIRLGGVTLMSNLTDNLFIHMRAVRAVTMSQDNRAQRSIVDHRNIIAALAVHDAERAEQLVREHTLGLAAHVEKFGDWDDAPAATGWAAATPNGPGREGGGGAGRNAHGPGDVGLSRSALRTSRRSASRLNPAAAGED